MLKIFDKNHNAIGHIVKYKDCKKESEIATGDKMLSFTYLAAHHDLENEFYVWTKDDEYVIKEISETSDGFPQIVAVLNLEDLEAKTWQTFSVADKTIDEAARTVLAGTGWTIGECNVTKRRNAGMMQVSTLEVLQNLCTAFMCEIVFDTINKKVSFYDKLGEDKGVYFMSGLNLKKLQKKSTSYDYYTRIIPIGANDLTIESVNNGKNYLENYQYSSKVLEYIWKDENYTDAQAMLEDAELKLDDMSKPEKSYSAEVRDLAKQKPEYSILSYKLGDTITLIDRNTGTREKQRIKKLVEYPQNPEKNTCELANTFLTFEEMQQKVQNAAKIIDYTIAGDGRYTGTVSISDILHFEDGLANSNTVAGINSSITSMQGELAQVKLTIGEVETNYLKADEADIKYATIENLKATNETVHSIRGDYAEFKTTTTQELAAQSGIIDNLSGDFSSYKTQVSQELIVAKGWMEEGSIGSAQISDLDANKLRSGTLDTALVNIAGTDGRLQIADNTIQIKDANHVRVQVGKDASGDYSLSVWDAAGNLVWDALGATENTIQRKIIRDRMVADDAAIQALKLDLQSFNTALTNQGVTISGTVVQVGSKTLNVALSEQTQLITEQGETLSDHAAKIAANEKAIALRVTTQDFNSYKTTTDGEIASAKSRLSATESSITAMQGEISLKVEQTDINTAVEEIEGKLSDYSTTSQMNAAITAAQNSITSTVAEVYTTKEEISTANGKISSLESWKAEASQKITKDGIIATVGNYYAYQSDLAAATSRLATVETKATQTADKFNWIVKSGSSATDFTLTDRTAQLITDSLTIKDKTGAATIISGGRMDIEKIFAQDITATGTIRGAKLIGGSITTESGMDYFNISGVTVKSGTNWVVIVTDPDTDMDTTIAYGEKEVLLEMGSLVFRSEDEMNSKSYEVSISCDVDAKQISVSGNIRVYGTIVANNLKSVNGDINVNSGLNVTGKITASGGIQLPNTAVSWIGGMTTTKCIVGSPYTSATGGTFHPILRQNTALGNVFVLGGITASSTDDRFGIYIFKNGRTANGYDYATYWNAVTGMLSHDGNLHIGGGIVTVKSASSSEAQVNVENTLCGGRLVASGGGNFGLYDTNRSKWIVKSDTNGVVTLNGHADSDLALTGGTVTGEFKFADYSGTARRPASSATTDGARVAYIASKQRSSDAAYYITINGQYGKTGSTYASYNYLSTTSDVRLKTNIVPTVTEALPVINQIFVRKFDWIETGIHQRLGLVADEIELIDPRFVFGGGYDEETGAMNVKGIDTLTLSAYLVKGIQELCAIDMKQNTDLIVLESKWQSCESCIESLQGQNTDIRDELTQLRTENAGLRAELAQLRAMVAA